MKRKFWNWVKNEGALEERTLFLNGEIFFSSTSLVIKHALELVL